MNHLIDDVRLAIRGFRKTPGVTAVIVLALALGIGVNSSCFVYVSGLLLHPFPYPELDRIMTVWESPADHPGERGPVTPANFLDLKETNASFAALSAYRPWNANLSGVGDPERVQACMVTPEFFAALGLSPTLGRALGAEDAEAGTLVVSHGFWTSRLAGSPSAIGKTVSLNGAVYTIVGVMPEEFNFPLETEMWVPLGLTAAERHDRTAHSLSLLGRLKPGVSVTQARAELATVANRLASEHPDTNQNRGFQTVPLRELADSYTARFILTLLVTAGFVLLLACANVANLFLVRLADRQREIAIRSAMGASRARIITQLLVESAVIALVAGAIGIDFAAWVVAHRDIPPEVYQFVGGLRTAHVDSTTVVLTIGVSLIAGFLCVLPSLSLVLRESASARLSDSLKESGRSGSGGRARSRLRTTLAVFEVTMALILLVGAGAMVRTFQRFLNVNPGFDTAKLLTMQIALPQSKYSGATAAVSFYERLLEGLRDRDARAAAVAADEAPDALYIEGRPAPEAGESTPELRAVSGRYFETLRLPVMEGRAISSADDRDHPLAVVLSASLARQYWPDASAIGRHVRLLKNDPRWLTVVGICGDTKHWFSSQPERRAYVSFLQFPEAGATVYMRTTGDPLLFAAGARAEVQKIDSTQAVFEVKTMEQRMAEETSGVHAASTSMVMYAFIGLFLAASGIYGVISYSVARRTHEIGVRMALGADRATVLRLTLRDAIKIGAIGLGIGVPIAFAMIRAMSSVLYGIIQLDAATFFGLTLILAICAVAAGYIPALRASRLDPVTALRNE